MNKDDRSKEPGENETTRPMPAMIGKVLADAEAAAKAKARSVFGEEKPAQTPTTDDSKPEPESSSPSTKPVPKPEPESSSPSTKPVPKPASTTSGQAEPAAAKTSHSVSTAKPPRPPNPPTPPKPPRPPQSQTTATAGAKTPAKTTPEEEVAPPASAKPVPKPAPAKPTETPPQAAPIKPLVTPETTATEVTAKPEPTDATPPWAVTRPVVQPAPMPLYPQVPARTQVPIRSTAPTPSQAPAGTYQPSTKPAQARQSRTRKRRVNPFVVVLVTLLVLTLSGVGTVLALAKSYEDKAKIGTTLAGIEVAGLTEAELRMTVEELYQKSLLSLIDGQLMAVFPLADLGIEIDVQATVDKALKSDSSFTWWPFRSINIPLALSYSTIDLQGKINATFIDESEVPQNAYVTWDEEENRFVTVPAVEGRVVELASVTEGISRLATEGYIDTIEIVKSIDLADILTPAADQATAAANSKIDQKFTFTSGSKSYTLKAKQVSPWLTFTPSPEAGAIEVSIDEEALANDLPGILDNAIATPPVDMRILYTPKGRRIAIERWGRDGTGLADPELVVTEMKAALRDGKPLTLSVKIVHKSYQTIKVRVGGAYDQPHGSKWIDVNQSTFRVSVWEGTTLIRVIPCVTGHPATPTLNGTYYIYSKYVRVDMSGTEADGVTPRFTANVPWTMFYYAGYALHGAYWRSSFGYRASHGCVNLPVSQAKWLFAWAPLGTKVVVHW